MTNEEESPPVPQIKYLCGTRAGAGMAWKDQMLGLGSRRLEYGASSLRLKVPPTYINKAMSRGQQTGQGGCVPLTSVYYISCGCLQGPPCLSSHVQRCASDPALKATAAQEGLSTT